jgi:diaminopimelate decarboxylase
VTCTTYKSQKLFIEEINVNKLLEKVGTPCFIYSKKQLCHNWSLWINALQSIKKNKVCFAVKANSNIHMLQQLSELGAGFDIVSIGELQRALKANAKPQNIVYSGVGKQEHEIEFALKKNIYCFNVESMQELQSIEKISKHLNLKAPIAIRLNPNIAVDSHPYLTTGTNQDKFGIDANETVKLAKQYINSPHLDLLGFSVHVGSQLKSSIFLKQALEIMDVVIKQLPSNFKLKYLNIGGGLGVSYNNEIYPTPEEFLQPVLPLLPSGNYTLVVEPGRSMVANTGFLATKVIYLKTTKHENFCIVDTAMNDLIRPALYQAEHRILPVDLTTTEKAKKFAIVGPVCESGDVLSKSVSLSINQNDHLLFADTGAYAFSMSSNYNSRPRPCEILIDHDQALVIRQRETFSDLILPENNIMNLSK